MLLSSRLANYSSILAVGLLFASALRFMFEKALLSRLPFPD